MTAKARSIDELRQKLAASGEELTELDKHIATSVVDGADDAALAKVRQRRRDLFTECEDLNQAIEIAARRAQADAAKAAEASLKERRADAARKAKDLLVAAAEVDAALANLDAAFEKLGLASLDASRALRFAGMSDDVRITNGISRSIRWATWAAAPGFAEKAEIPFANAARRKALRESVATLIPNIRLT